MLSKRRLHLLIVSGGAISIESGGQAYEMHTAERKVYLKLATLSVVFPLMNSAYYAEEGLWKVCGYFQEIRIYQFCWIAIRMLCDKCIHASWFVIMHASRLVLYDCTWMWQQSWESIRNLKSPKRILEQFWNTQSSTLPIPACRSVEMTPLSKYK